MLVIMSQKGTNENGNGLLLYLHNYSFYAQKVWTLLTPFRFWNISIDYLEKNLNVWFDIFFKKNLGDTSTAWEKNSI